MATPIVYVHGSDEPDHVDIALAEGCDVRFRADAYGSHNADECPCCSATGRLRWRGNLVPELWDSMACDSCDHGFAVESLVLEGLPTCHSWRCERPGLNRCEIREYADKHVCGDPKCVEELKAEAQDARECDADIWATERSLMAGRI